MPGNMGNEQVTVRHLKVVKVDAEKGILLIKGAIPGAEGGLVTVRPAVKVGR
ncbi:50S ribosomal protein L3 [compost metagenome]